MSRRRIVVYTVQRYDWRYNDEYYYEDQQRFLQSFLSREKAEAYREKLEAQQSDHYSEEMFSVVENLIEMED
jgi:hypothetical protein